MTAKTPAQRQQDLRARRLAEGLTEVRGIYLPLNQHAALKLLAKMLTHNAELSCPKRPAQEHANGTE